MKKSVLAFNFKPERVGALKQTCMIAKLPCRLVAEGEMENALGYLAGIEGVPPTAVNPELEVALGEDGKPLFDFTPEELGEKELLFFCGFDRPLLELFLGLIRRGPLKNVALKAMLTPHNVQWSGAHLLREVAEEDAYMKLYNGKGAPATAHREEKK